MVNYIWITTQKEFFHKYKNAPKEVKFLRNLHRHIFHFKIYIEVFSNDRDIEFIMFKKFIEKILSKFNNEIDSCEYLSNLLWQYINDKYPKRDIKIEISEDGENGICFYYPKS